MLPLSHMSRTAPQDVGDDGLDLVFKALADPTRRRLMDLLHAGPRTTGELCAGFEGLSRFAVMKHLRVLIEAELVLTSKQGRIVQNHLNAIPLRRVYERWVSKYESVWAESLVALKRSIERSANKPRP